MIIFVDNTIKKFIVYNNLKINNFALSHNIFSMTHVLQKYFNAWALEHNHKIN